MTTTQIASVLTLAFVSLVSYFIGAARERAIAARRVKTKYLPIHHEFMVQPIIKYTLQPVELKFEQEFDPIEARYRQLSEGEQKWQERRQMASLVNNRLYGLLMDDNTTLVEKYETPRHRSPNEKYTITYIIRILPNPEA